MLHPQSIAVIGASEEPRKLGHYILSNLLTQGYKGKVYPVNPKHEMVMGKRAYKTVEDIPEAVDLAIVAIPALAVLDVAEECGRKKVKTLIVISAGFSELKTEEGRTRETELANIANAHGMRLLGPNCLGLLRPKIGLNASFSPTLPRSGSIALISQSGALAVAIMDQARALDMGFSFIVSIGNKADLDEVDWMEIASEDRETTVIGLYLESIQDGTRFLEAASRIQARKRIVLIKAGTSARGQAAVSSHTGSLAGSSAAIVAACDAAGILYVQTMEEFLMALRVLATQPPLLSQSIAIITNAGGPGVLATDAAERVGLSLPSLQEKQKNALKASLPEAASSENPIDVLGDALADRYQQALEACAKDPGIDGIAVLLTPQVMTPAVEIANVIGETARTHPLMPIVASFMGGDSVEQARHVLGEGGIPHFPAPEAAIQALSMLRALKPRPSAPLREDRDQISSAAAALLKGASGLLPESVSADLLSLYQLPIETGALAQSEDEAVELSNEIGFPVVAKVSSPDILHKTDIGAVRVNLRSEKDVRAAFREIMENCKKHAPTAGIAGILIQEFLPAGSEFIVGGLRDPSFGPLVMVGLGGIYTELFKDTAFAIAPLSEDDAYGLLQKLASWKLLTGMRAREQKDIAALAKLVSDASFLITECEDIRELDLNPVIVREDGIVIADAKVIV